MPGTTPPSKVYCTSKVKVKIPCFYYKRKYTFQFLHLYEKLKTQWLCILQIKSTISNSSGIILTALGILVVLWFSEWTFFLQIKSDDLWLILCLINFSIFLSSLDYIKHYFCVAKTIFKGLGTIAQICEYHHNIQRRLGEIFVRFRLISVHF